MEMEMMLEVMEVVNMKVDKVANMVADMETTKS